MPAWSGLAQDKLFLYTPSAKRTDALYSIYSYIVKPIVQSIPPRRPEEAGISRPCRRTAEDLCSDSVETSCVLRDGAPRLLGMTEVALAPSEDGHDGCEVGGERPWCADRGPVG